MVENIDYFLLGAFGAAAAEMLKLYQRRARLTEKRFRQLLASLKHWLIFLGMVFASGFIAWAVHTGSHVGVWPVVLSGIGASALIRLPPESIGANRKVHLGDEDFWDYFS